MVMDPRRGRGGEFSKGCGCVFGTRTVRESDVRVG